LTVLVLLPLFPLIFFFRSLTKKNREGIGRVSPSIILLCRNLSPVPFFLLRFQDSTSPTLFFPCSLAHSTEPDQSFHCFSFSFRNPYFHVLLFVTLKQYPVPQGLSFISKRNLARSHLWTSFFPSIKFGFSCPFQSVLHNCR